MVQTPNIKLEKPAEGTRPWTDAVNGNWDKIDAAVAKINSVPIGTIVPYAADEPPEGWLKCDGSKVSRTTYSALFAKIGTKYGSGDGSETFDLPNFIDKTFWGGASSGTYKAAGLPNIKGALSNLRAVTDLRTGAFAASKAQSDQYTGASAKGGYLLSPSFEASKSNAIYGKSATVQPPALTTIVCIKY
jgi:microcystin-dependent protein